MTREMTDQRFRLTVGSATQPGVDLAREVELGLRAEPKRLPCRFFYDDAGSRLFEEICELREYYLTRAEDEILAQRSAEIVSRLPEGIMLVELGSGSATKTRRVIEAALESSRELVYVPIDISQGMLEASSRELLAAYPALSIHALAAEYEAAVDALRRERARPKLVLWLGSNVGNFDRREAARFLGRISSALQPDDRLLVGIDRRKPREILEAAYDDSRGVTARFNLNLLERINTELGGRFDIAAFRHVALYDDIEGRIEMHLESRSAHTVHIEALGMDVRFERGERVHTENSYKYSSAEIAELCRSAKLALERTWYDSRSLFGVHLLAPAIASGARAPLVP
jgi:dimethylhistidine N-methyltransferase